jgi:hypothetical protein
MSEDIAGLSDIVAALAEETRGRRPNPTLRWVTRDGPATTVFYTRPALRPIDEDAIVKAEEEAALSTVLPLATGREPAAMGFALSGRWRNPGVSEADHAGFYDEVEEYKKGLRRFLKNLESYRALGAPVLPMAVYVDNDGGGPATEARVRLRFPDPLERGEWPERPRRPRRPKFKKPTNPHGRLMIPRHLLLSERLKDIRPISLPNPDDPFYEDGSVLVRFNYGSIPHGDPFDSRTFFVRCEAPGKYAVPWTIHAANLPQPAKGELVLEVQDQEANTTPITTLAGLLGEGRPES